MRTRKRIIKSPRGGRRSSIICVKKSPLPPRRNNNNNNNNRGNIRGKAPPRNRPAPNRLATYESPLGSIYVNSATPSPASRNTSLLSPARNRNLPSTSTSTSLHLTPSVKKESSVAEDAKKCRELNVSVVEVFATSPSPSEKDASKEEDNMSVMSVHSNTSTQSKKRSINAIIGAGELPTRRTKKLKKSPLSRFNDDPPPKNPTNSPAKPSAVVSESIIIVDDDSKPEAPASFGAAAAAAASSSGDDKATVTIEHSGNAAESHKSRIVRGMTRSEDVVVLDCNDSLITEMEEFHRVMNKSSETAAAMASKSTAARSNFADSIIVIDHDEDPPVSPPATQPPKQQQQQQKQQQQQPAVEDCFVVWSSMPPSQPSTSTSQPSTSGQLSSISSISSSSGSSILKTPLLMRPPMSNNADLLKCDKIMLDIGGDYSNLRFLDNPATVGGGGGKKVKRLGTTKPAASATTTSGFFAKAAAAAAKGNKKAKAAAGGAGLVKTAVKAAAAKKGTKSKDLMLKKKDDENAATVKKKKGQLREIVIDGCNVAMAYTHNKTFDEKGIKMCIDYFTKRGHTVKVFVPQHKRAVRHPLLEKWHNEGIVVFTPSRKIGNKNFTPYDDRYILAYATACKGIVVSQDQFRDLYNEKPEFRDTIENRLLVPTFVGDYVMFPEDPLGRNGPALNAFLKH